MISREVAIYISMRNDVPIWHSDYDKDKRLISLYAEMREVYKKDKGFLLQDFEINYAGFYSYPSKPVLFSDPVFSTFGMFARMVLKNERMRSIKLNGKKLFIYEWEENGMFHRGLQ